MFKIDFKKVVYSYLYFIIFIFTPNELLNAIEKIGLLLNQWTKKMQIIYEYCECGFLLLLFIYVKRSS